MLRAEGVDPELIKKVKMGSMYFGNNLAKLGGKYPGQGEISFVNSVEGIVISWVPVNGVLIADRVLCNAISWNDLLKMGYIWGIPVRIDGKAYLCRVLEREDEDNQSCEWSDAIGKVGSDAFIWHWGGICAFSQDTIETSDEARLNYTVTCRGYGGKSAFTWEWANIDQRSKDFGFRPVLVPLPEEITLVDESLIGSHVKVFSNMGWITSRVKDFTDYDLVLDGIVDAEPMRDNADPLEGWVSWSGERDSIVDTSKTEIFVDRSSIIYMHLEESEEEFS